MKKELPSSFEVIGMLQMAIRAFEASPRATPKTELEKNGLEMVKESVRILSEDVLITLSAHGASGLV